MLNILIDIFRQEFKRIISHDTSISVLFSKFVNLADSVGHNGMSHLFAKC